MPGDPFKTKPHSGTQGQGKVKPSKPAVGKSMGKAPVLGAAPGGPAPKGLLIGQPSVSRTPHIQKRSQMPKARTGASLKRGKSPSSG